jgi:predicted branched-subunit amino acid permease
MFFLKANFRHAEFRQGFKEMGSVAPGIAAWGLMTGVAMVKSGMGTLDALFMAVTVFAGSSQLAATPLLMAGAPMWVILATAFCVNLRFVVFSAQLRPYVMHLPLWQRLVTGYFTADITYVMFVKRYPLPAQDAAGRAAQMAYMAGSGCLNWVSWIIPSVLGVVLANGVPPQWGLGFAGILALLGMTCALASSRLRWVAAAAAAVAGVATYGLPFKLNILVGIAAAVVLCMALEKRVLPAAAPGEGS